MRAIEDDAEPFCGLARKQVFQLNQCKGQKISFLGNMQDHYCSLYFKDFCFYLHQQKTRPKVMLSLQRPKTREGREGFSSFAKKAASFGLEEQNSRSWYAFAFAVVRPCRCFRRPLKISCCELSHLLSKLRRSSRGTCQSF